MIQERRLIDQFLEMVQIDSESKHERLMADYLKVKMEELGFKVEEDNAGESFGGNAGNILAYHKGNGTGKSLLFCAHMDTVLPGNGVKPIEDGDVIRSDGTTVLGGDDKAGIAAILEALRVMKEKNIEHGPIQVIFTVAEEIGLLGAKYVDMDKRPPVDGAFFFDSDGMPNLICVASPYHIDLTATFKGKSAHAGVEPEKGINAIQIASRAIADMKLGRLDEETTANIGMIQGGRATNVVPDEVVIYGEARSLTKAKVDSQVEDMINCCKKAAEAYGGTVDIDVDECYAAIDLDPNSTTVQLASQALRKMGMEPELVKSGGGSDANVFCGKGIPATNLGVGMTNVHSIDEYLEVPCMIAASKFVLAVAEEAK